MTKEKKEFHQNLIKWVKKYGVKTCYKTEEGNVITGDGGVDMIGEHKNVMFLVQCKNYTKDKVQPSQIREFIGALSSYPTETLGIFVTTVGYSRSSLGVAKNSKYDILLATIDNLIKEFSSYVNKRRRDPSDDYDEVITAESVDT